MVKFYRQQTKNRASSFPFSHTIENEQKELKKKISELGAALAITGVKLHTSNDKEDLEKELTNFYIKLEETARDVRQFTFKLNIQQKYNKR